MKIAAIIAEYNPFHSGHAAHIEFTKNSGFDAVVAIVSPNFVQRGDVACADKWTRAKMALNHGVDLIVELPTPAAISPAENFAKKGVELAHSLGCVNTLSFGVESAIFEDFERTFLVVDSADFKKLLQENLAKGMSYPAALSASAVELREWQTAEVLRNPNNTLGFEYFKANARHENPFDILTYKRFGKHDEISLDIEEKLQNLNSLACQRATSLNSQTLESCEIASAMQIRKMMEEGLDFKRFLSEESYKILNEEIGQGFAPTNILNLESALLYKLRTMSQEEFKRLPDVSEGLENRIFNAVKNAVSYEDLILKIKTKRYTQARIRRILIAALLEIDRVEMEKPLQYIKVLGMNEVGEKILKAVKNTATLPLVTSFKDVQKLDESAWTAFEVESKATDVFGLAAKNVRECGREKTAKIVKI